MFQSKMMPEKVEQKMNSLLRGYLSSACKLATPEPTSEATRVFAFVPWQQFLASSGCLLRDGVCYLEVRLEKKASTTQQTGWTANFLLKVGCQQQPTQKSLCSLHSKLCLYPSGHIHLHHQSSDTKKIAASGSVLVPTADIFVQVCVSYFRLSWLTLIDRLYWWLNVCRVKWIAFSPCKLTMPRISCAGPIRTEPLIHHLHVKARPLIFLSKSDSASLSVS